MVSTAIESNREIDSVNDLSSHLSVQYDWFVNGEMDFQDSRQLLETRQRIGARIMMELTNNRMAYKVGSYEINLWNATRSYQRVLES
jgi:hypothetical protein